MDNDLDEEEILHLTSSRDGIPISYEIHGNPFKLDNDQNVFLTNCNLTSRSMSSNGSRRLTLVERNMMTTPRVSSFTTRATRLKEQRESQSSLQTTRSREPVHKARTVSMNEFVQQKRKIYRANIAIEKQTRSTQQYEARMERSERDVQLKEEAIKTKTDQIKTRTNELEMKLIKATREMEALSKENIDLTLKMKQLEVNLNLARAENEKMNDPINQATECKEFLYEIMPTGYTDPFDFFDSPKRLTNELASIETECLRTVEKYDELENRLSKGFDMESFLNEDKEMLEKVEKIIEKQKRVKQLYTSSAADETNSVEEFSRLSALVDEAYNFCFPGKKTAQSASPYEQLERISHRYDELQRLVDEYSTMEMTTIILKTIKQRKKEAAKQRMLDRLTTARTRKFPHARKTTFVIKGNNRKLNERYLPLKPKKETSAKDRDAEIERLRLEKLLFEENED